jgi:hypothetical protein
LLSNNALIANEKPRRFGGTGAFGPGNSQGLGDEATPLVRPINALPLDEVSLLSLTILLPSEPRWIAF